MQLAWLVAAVLAPAALAQSSTSSAPANATTSANANSTRAANSTLSYITTTITSLVSSGTASPSPTTFVLTLTLNSTAYQNGTVTNSTTGLNGTTLTNGTSTNATEPWKAGDDWIPFAIPIDATYGVLGAFLIITGIPVAVLGGKNRWTSLAVVSGYTLMLFCLIMVLRFGVQPNIQPPSPNPPSSLLRGLYLLACIISSFIGAAIGIFFYRFAKYWVSAAGGFAFGWFLLAVKSGGLITAPLGRWGLLVGLTVAMFVASLPEKLNPWMVLIATAWIGATAFILGIDCYVRSGLKEFYIYNLGFWDLFVEPLGEAPYPLTQTMQIELGILAAVVIIGAAIQFKVLNILQKRMREFKEEEEARLEADEVAKAAERFKNVGVDLNEWEEKHGKYQTLGSGTSKDLGEGPSGVGSGIASLGDANASNVALPRLDFNDADLNRAASSSRRPVSELSLLADRVNQGGSYQHLPLSSPGLESHHEMEVLQPERRDAASPVRAGSSSPTGTDPDLESKMRLLEEVKRAREEVRSSLDMLRQKTPSIYSLDAGRHTPGPSSAGLEDPPYAARLSTTSIPLASEARDARMSTGGNIGADGGRDKRVSTSSSYMLDQMDRPTTAPATATSFTNVPAPPAQPAPAARPLSDWERYTQERRIEVGAYDAAGAAPRTRVSSGPLLGQHQPNPRMSMVGSQSTALEPSMSRRSLDLSYPARVDDRRMSNVPPGGAMNRSSTHYDSPNAPIIVGGSTASAGAGRAPGDYASHSLGAAGQAKRGSMTRTMTVDELSERHRQRLSKLQDPISSKMKEEAEVAAARARWEKQKRIERADMRRREEEKIERLKDKEAEPNSPGARTRRHSRPQDDSRGRMEEWRRSVHGLSGIADGSTPANPRGEPSRRMSQGPPATGPFQQQQQQQRGSDTRGSTSQPRQRSSRHFAS